MTYPEAVKWREEHLTIIGTVDQKGFVVSDLFIVPSDPVKQNTFLRTYLFTDNKESAMLPYMSEDVQVWSVDLNRLESDNILFFNALAK